MAECATSESRVRTPVPLQRGAASLEFASAFLRCCRMQRAHTLRSVYFVHPHTASSHVFSFSFRAAVGRSADRTDHAKPAGGSDTATRGRSAVLAKRRHSMRRTAHLASRIARLCAALLVMGADVVSEHALLPAPLVPPCLAPCRVACAHLSFARSLLLFLVSAGREQAAQHHSGATAQSLLGTNGRHAAQQRHKWDRASSATWHLCLRCTISALRF